MKNHIIKLTLILCVFGSLIALVYSQYLKGIGAQVDGCAQRICQNDKLPKYDWYSYELFKIDNVFYIAPKQYGGLNGVLSFFWPSRAPVQRPDLAPEFKRDNGRGPNNYRDVKIDIFVQSSAGLKVAPLGFQFIEEATAKGWVEQRKTISANLDEYTMKHVSDARGYFVDDMQYYVATNLKGSDGLPPVATCSHTRPDNQGGSGFLWHRLWVGVRMNQKHCSEWSEIFPEVERVLAQIKEIQ